MFEVVEQADIVIIEGINVLQSPTLEDDRENPRILFPISLIFRFMWMRKKAGFSLGI